MDTIHYPYEVSGLAPESRVHTTVPVLYSRKVLVFKGDYLPISKWVVLLEVSGCLLFLASLVIAGYFLYTSEELGLGELLELFFF